MGLEVVGAYVLRLFHAAVDVEFPVPVPRQFVALAIRLIGLQEQPSPLLEQSGLPRRRRGLAYSSLDRPIEAGRHQRGESTYNNPTDYFDDPCQDAPPNYASPEAARSRIEPRGPFHLAPSLDPL